MVDERSRRYGHPGLRGSLKNIAVKVYGTKYDDATPRIGDWLHSTAMFEPWFRKGTYAFQVHSYDPVAGGANKDGTGELTINSVDLAVLTVNTGIVFALNGIPMREHLQRLIWVEKDQDM